MDNVVRMAERSKALRSGRSPLLWAWVRIPLLTTNLLSVEDIFSYFILTAWCATRRRRTAVEAAGSAYSPRRRLGASTALCWNTGMFGVIGFLGELCRKWTLQKNLPVRTPR